MRNKRKIIAAICLAATMLCTSVAGCAGGGTKSQEDILKEMKEFSTPDKSASIYLNKDWEIQDLGLEDAGIDY